MQKCNKCLFYKYHAGIKNDNFGLEHCSCRPISMCVTEDVVSYDCKYEYLKYKDANANHRCQSFISLFKLALVNFFVAYLALLPILYLFILQIRAEYDITIVIIAIMVIFIIVMAMVVAAIFVILERMAIVLYKHHKISVGKYTKEDQEWIINNRPELLKHAR